MGRPLSGPHDLWLFPLCSLCPLRHLATSPTSPHGPLRPLGETDPGPSPRRQRIGPQKRPARRKSNRVLSLGMVHGPRSTIHGPRFAFQGPRSKVRVPRSPFLTTPVADSGMCRSRWLRELPVRGMGGSEHCRVAPGGNGGMPPGGGLLATHRCPRERPARQLCYCAAVTLFRRPWNGVRIAPSHLISFPFIPVQSSPFRSGNGQCVCTWICACGCDCVCVCVCACVCVCVCACACACACA